MPALRLEIGNGRGHSECLDSEFKAWQPTSVAQGAFLASLGRHIGSLEANSPQLRE